MQRKSGLLTIMMKCLYLALSFGMMVTMGCVPTSKENAERLAFKSVTELEELLASPDSDDRFVNDSLVKVLSGEYSCKNKINFVETLIRHGGNVDYIDENGRSLLTMAISAKCIPLLKTLTKLGADLNLADRYSGETAILRACEYGLLDEVNFLLGEGADATLPDKHGRLPIHVASQNSSAVLKRVIASADSTVNSRCAHGLSALFYVLMSDLTVDEKNANIELLLTAGANPNYRLSGKPIPDSTVGVRAGFVYPSQGESPIEFAERIGPVSLADTLRR